MEPELTKEEVEQRARELARRVMGKPHVKQEWPRKPKPKPRQRTDHHAEGRVKGQRRFKGLDWRYPPDPLIVGL